MNGLLGFWNSTVGKKAVMAVTGLIGFGFAMGHMVGNLQVFAGPQAINDYAVFLHKTKPLLWGTRLVVLAAVILHILAALQLQGIKNAARPVRYQRPGNIQATPGARTMTYTGVLLLLFLLYHLAHFTWGNAHPDFQDLQPFHNVVVGFSSWAASVFYMICMLLLGLHLAHGTYSLFFSLGLVHPRYQPGIKTVAYGLVMLLIACNISIPVAVMAGVLKQ